MKRPAVAARTSASGPNRLLVALAAAWMILSLAIGGAVNADTNADATSPSSITGTTSQP